MGSIGGSVFSAQPRSRVCLSARLSRIVFLAAVALVTLFTPSVKGQAPPPDALNFYTSMFITGDYVVSGVNLRGTGVNGIATGTISIAGVPANGSVVAAYLYWETVSTQGTALSGASFRGHDISALAIDLVPSGTAPCWSSGGGTGGS